MPRTGGFSRSYFGLSFDEPHGVCLSSDGQLLYVANAHSHTVQVLRASDGTNLRTYGGGGVTDGNNDSSSSSNSGGDVQFHCPVGVCVRRAPLPPPAAATAASTAAAAIAVDELFVSDMCNHRVVVLRAVDGALLREFGGAGEFQCPAGVCLSPDGALLYVADRDARRVQVRRAADGARACRLQ